MATPAGRGRVAGPIGERSCASAPPVPALRSRPVTSATDPRDKRQFEPTSEIGLERYGARVHTGDADLAPSVDEGAGTTGGRAHSHSPVAIEELVAAALDGDQAAWQQIVDRHAGLVWSVVRGFRLGQAEASDVAQTVWLRLVENLPRVQQPAALPGWLATTARRESIRALRRTQREVPSESVLDEEGTAPDEDSPEWHLLATERQQAVWRAVSTLARRCQVLLRALAYDAGHSYAEISAALNMPVGSIGPTRSRCLQQLRRALNPAAPGGEAGNERGGGR